MLLSENGPQRQRMMIKRSGMDPWGTPQVRRATEEDHSPK